MYCLQTSLVPTKIISATTRLNLLFWRRGGCLLSSAQFPVEGVLLKDAPTWEPFGSPKSLRRDSEPLAVGFPEPARQSAGVMFALLLPLPPPSPLSALPLPAWLPLSGPGTSTGLPASPLPAEQCPLPRTGAENHLCAQNRALELPLKHS